MADEISQNEFSELFSPWWASIDTDDKRDFLDIFKGSENLARFVCALEYYSVRMGKRSIPESYALAFGCNLASAKKNAYGTGGLKHPAVAALLVSLRQQSREVAWARVEHKYAQLLEVMADSALKAGAPVIERFYAAASLQKFGAMVARDEAFKRQREKAAAGVTARGKLTPLRDDTPITEENARLLVGLIRAQLGQEKLDALTRAALPA